MFRVHLSDVEIAASPAVRQPDTGEAADEPLVATPPLGLSFTLHVAKPRVMAARKLKELQLPAQATGE